MPQHITYTVSPFTPAALAEALSNQWVDAEATRRRQHFYYFAEYLGHEHDGLGARTIMVESPYLSQSFLDDYADYYARGFTAYERLCKRVHFFREAFDQAALEVALLDPQAGGELWNSYLGYIVIKPLPARQIGATLLQPYQPATDKQRAYPARRPYEINVLGKQLRLETLIFQEQDNNVSACATTALWMAFHKTASLFHTTQPSPYHITSAARNLFYRRGRTFPSTGLDHTQIGEAIQSVGLVADLTNYRQAAEWGADSEAAAVVLREQLRGAKGLIYAYVRLGLPVLLFILLDEREERGHLVTVTGYRLATSRTQCPVELALTSDALDRLYVHDDQMGPFARYGFTDDGRLLTPWPLDDWEPAGPWHAYRRASLYSIFVPLTADIRITYEQVFRQTVLFEQLFAGTIQERADVVWDIYLDYSNHYKEELRQRRPVEGEPLRRILVSVLPKYVWVARATLQQVALLDLVFDATDLHTGFYCLLVNVFEPLRDSLATWLGRDDFRQQLLAAPKFDPRFLPLLLRGLQVPVAEDV
ncbi:hypothetical protein MTX78_24905 (plasmid) [Hymenobacter tibetensis]|uniref:Peptidase C39-like domain-containing protein n=1 Tax=Hymenobacter tibetensis TaxID=497967 RepID=A0ABY4D6H9_9BACT|nr:hypothetical protein [Hymenobacter tibetensis]UOG77652.1 hypothetical protein MTX78_24905 [Hymenobacter tibetensis]